MVDTCQVNIIAHLVRLRRPVKFSILVLGIHIYGVAHLELLTLIVLLIMLGGFLFLRQRLVKHSFRGQDLINIFLTIFDCVFAEIRKLIKRVLPTLIDLVNFILSFLNFLIDTFHHLVEVRAQLSRIPKLVLHL